MEERTVKKNMMRLIAILLTLVLLMGTLISFAETAEENFWKESRCDNRTGCCRKHEIHRGT